MARKPKTTAEDMVDDDFDIESTSPVNIQTPNVLQPPSLLLTSAKVAAVRFHSSKRGGYEYTQVETFVDQVTESLNFYEAQLYQAQLDVHSRQDEIYDLQETISRLKATIEVFRAKGDPVTNADGSYLTESQVGSEMDVSVFEEEIRELKKANAALSIELSKSRADADQGWEAEAEMRRYVDEELQPWAAEINAKAETLETALKEVEAKLAAAVSAQENANSSDDIVDAAKLKAEVAEKNAAEAAQLAAKAAAELAEAKKQASEFEAKAVELAEQTETLAAQLKAKTVELEELSQRIPAPVEVEPVNVEVEVPVEPEVDPADAEIAYREKLAAAVRELEKDTEEVLEENEEQVNAEAPIAEVLTEPTTAVVETPAELPVENPPLPVVATEEQEGWDEDYEDEEGFDIVPEVVSTPVLPPQAPTATTRSPFATATPSTVTTHPGHAVENEAPWTPEITETDAAVARRLASSPEVAALQGEGEEPEIKPQPPKTSTPKPEVKEETPRPAGAPLPRLLASAPEVLAVMDDDLED